MSQFDSMLLTMLVGLAPVVSMAQESQLKVEVEPRDSISSVVSYGWIDTQAALADAKFQSARLALNPPPTVKKALDENEALMAKLFQPGWPKLEGIATLSVNGRDILLAKWKREPIFSKVRSVAVWDDPDFDLFLFEVDPSMLKSTEDIQTFWKDLFVFPNGALELTGIQFKMARAAELGTVGAGRLEYRGGPESIVLGNDLRGYALFVGAYRMNKRAYMCVWVGKRLFREMFDRDIVFIPERFPPLKERLKEATTPSLLDQLAGPQPRVSVVADELVLRKLTAREFAAMLDVSAEKLPERLSLILGAITETHGVSQYKDEINGLVQKYSRGTEYSPAVLGTMLDALEGTKEVDLSQTALDLIAKGADIPEAIRYLKFRADTEETAKRLQALKVPENWENLKQIVVSEILSRAQKQKEQK